MFAKSGCSIVFAGVVLAGCGTMPIDRGVSGGLFGAGAGAAIGALFGETGLGAIVGGPVGAAIGAITSPALINLGTPIWRQTSLHTDCVEWSPSTGQCVRTASAQAASTQTAAVHADCVEWSPYTGQCVRTASAPTTVVQADCLEWSPYTGQCVRTAATPTPVAQASTPSAAASVPAATHNVEASVRTTDWIASCKQRYRSFDPLSGTYLGYDGYRHYCEPS